KLVIGIQPEQLAPAHFLRLAAQLDLVLLPSPAGHDEACAKADPALRLKLVEAERPNHAIGRRQEGAPAALAMLDTADRHRVEDAQRTVPDDPFLSVRHAAPSCMSRAAPPVHCAKALTTAGPSMHPCIFKAKAA